MTLEQLQAAFPDKSPEVLIDRWNEVHPEERLQGGTPSLMQQLKGFVPAAGGALGQYGADAAVTALGNPELVPVAGGAGNALGSLLGRAVTGEGTSGAQFATDAALGAAMPYAGTVAKSAGKYLGKLRDAIPRTARYMGYGGGMFSGHPSLMGLSAAMEAGPAVLTKVGEGLDWAGKKLMSPFARSAEQNAAETAPAVVPRTTGINARGRGLTSEKPYRMGGSTQAPAGEPNIMSETRNAAQARPPLETSFRSANDLLKNPESLVAMDRMARETAAGQEMATFGTDAENVARQVGNRYGGTKVEYFPGGKTPRSFDELQATGYGPEASHEVDQLLRRSGLSGTAPAAAPAPRPAGNFIHPADTSGGKFGFDTLPEIGESELARLQNLFKRVTGR